MIVWSYVAGYWSPKVRCCVWTAGSNTPSCFLWSAPRCASPVSEDWPDTNWYRVGKPGDVGFGDCVHHACLSSDPSHTLHCLDLGFCLLLFLFFIQLFIVISAFRATFHSLPLPGYLTCVVAGFVSFKSLCVLTKVTTKQRTYFDIGIILAIHEINTKV